MSKENQLSRRTFLRSAAMTFAAAELAMIAPAGAPFRKETTMNQIAKESRTPEGPGSVSGAPNLPPGFTDMFTSRYIKTRELRQHAVIGGEGPPLLLVHGWPET